MGQQSQSCVEPQFRRAPGATLCHLGDSRGEAFRLLLEMGAKGQG